MRIVSIVSYQKKYQKNVVCAVEWDSGERADLDPETVVRFGLRSQMEIDESVYRSMREFDEKKKCLAAALNLISIRPRSVQELRDRFLREGYSESSVEENLAKLIENGYLNDAHFAVRFARSKLKKKNIGRRSLEYELKKKGIAADIMETVVKDIYSERDEAADALSAAEKKIQTLRGLEEANVRARLSLFLRQRGFSPDAVHAALKKLLK